MFYQIHAQHITVLFSSTTTKKGAEAPKVESEWSSVLAIKLFATLQTIERYNPVAAMAGQVLKLSDY